jgi:hypothetical protein
MMAMDDDDVMSGRGAAKASQPETETEAEMGMYMYTTRPGGAGLMTVQNAECRVLGFCLEPFVEVWD